MLDSPGLFGSPYNSNFLHGTILTFQILTISQRQYAEDHGWLPGHNIPLHVEVIF